MKTKKLTKEEVEKVQEVANRMLEVYGWEISVSPEPKEMTYHMNDKEVKEGWYYYTVKTKDAKVEFSDAFHENAQMLGITWHMVSEAWRELDGDINSPLAENLWPEANKWLPDMEKFKRKTRN